MLSLFINSIFLWHFQLGSVGHQFENLSNKLCKVYWAAVEEIVWLVSVLGFSVYECDFILQWVLHVNLLVH